MTILTIDELEMLNPYELGDILVKEISGASRTSYIESILWMGAEINHLHEGSITPLIAAASVGNLELVESLVSNGAAVNQRGGSNCNAVHSAAWRGHTDVLQYLVSKGADLSVQMTSMATPLYLAAYNGHSDAVDFILANGCDQPLDDTYDTSPMIAAFRQGYYDIVESLFMHDMISELQAGVIDDEIVYRVLDPGYTVLDFRTEGLDLIITLSTPNNETIEVVETIQTDDDLIYIHDDTITYFEDDYDDYDYYDEAYLAAEAHIVGICYVKNIVDAYLKIQRYHLLIESYLGNQSYQLPGLLSSR
ncbi:MAG: ankyrin repeat domain-containing protein [Ignavibacteria bacterium]|nr:ankyrin repeat domain-containing protein [Ignavibacteria bacterium]